MFNRRKFSVPERKANRTFFVIANQCYQTWLAQLGARKLLAHLIGKIIAQLVPVMNCEKLIGELGSSFSLKTDYNCLGLK